MSWKWEDNTKMYPGRQGCEKGAWMKLYQDHIEQDALVLDFQVILPESYYRLAERRSVSKQIHLHTKYGLLCM
jgi:hypothetical protein